MAGTVQTVLHEGADQHNDGMIQSLLVMRLQQSAFRRRWDISGLGTLLFIFVDCSFCSVFCGCFSTSCANHSFDGSLMVELCTYSNVSIDESYEVKVVLMIKHKKIVLHC